MHYKKKELLRMAGTLKEVNQLIKNASPGKLSSMSSVSTFEDCQQTAIEIGTELETRGESTQAVVKLLEDYCEDVYQMSCSLSDTSRCRRLAKKIQRELDQICRMIKCELPEEKKEVVFFPYKASMWDSLESVWMAAQEDEDCEAYVVPIPYFNKNPDGSLGQMHDEGKEYPDYVPVTDWRTYRIEEHRPDIVYIHNPYDKCNYVTTVHPDYYAENLKQYTDMLVYIPYFVGINNHIEEHFCTMPGVLYADRVIVESEEVKKQYLDLLHRFERENGRPGVLGDLDKKILALGSPKLDRVRRVRRENITVPEEWERLIQREGRQRKKVILYNTTIGAVLKNSGMVIKKIQDVLKTFQEDEEIVLLWRPHPLLQSTLRSMRPELYDKYCELVQTYRKDRWGIYDDTVDMERAIALSDAYYGDWSSMVTLYQVTGKPIMIQNYNTAMLHSCIYRD